MLAWAKDVGWGEQRDISGWRNKKLWSHSFPATSLLPLNRVFKLLAFTMSKANLCWSTVRKPCNLFPIPVSASLAPLPQFSEDQVPSQMLLAIFCKFINSFDMSSKCSFRHFKFLKCLKWTHSFSFNHFNCFLHWSRWPFSSCTFWFASFSSSHNIYNWLIYFETDKITI